MKTASILTYGCTHNQKDSQLIEAQLLKNGYQLVDENDAELVVVNTCTVKSPTENKIIRKLDDLRTKGHVIVTGCLSQSDPELIENRYPDYTVMGINAAKFLPMVLRQVNGETTQLKTVNTLNEEHFFDKPMMEGTQWNPHLHIVQINEGCLNSCTFCATKLARGRLQSYSRESIISSIRKTPTPEVWLTSQDTGCWGFDIKDNLSKLISEIDKIERKFWVRIGMGNPNNFIKILDDVIDAFESPKIYKFLHLPVQSGSNEVLKHMKRGYTVEEYEEIVTSFRRRFPELTLSTDVIVGYPTETEDDYLETVQTILKTRPSITNISRYWERENTPAALLKQLSHQVRMQRSKDLDIQTKEIQRIDNQKWIGWKGKMLVTEHGKKGGLVGRNLSYKQIVLSDESDDIMIGTWQHVKVIDSTPTYLYGEIIET